MDEVAAVFREERGRLLAALVRRFGDLDLAEEVTAEAIEAALAPVLESRRVKPGKLFQPIRVAISGGSVSPGIFESLATLGRERSLERIARATERLRAEAG